MNKKLLINFRPGAKDFEEQIIEQGFEIVNQPLVLVCQRAQLSATHLRRFGFISINESNELESKIDEKLKKSVKAL